MKILLVGKDGMLGEEFSSRLGEFEVLALGKDELDITDISNVSLVFDDFHPDWVINCAAYTNVDGAESDEDSAFAINAEGVKNLAVMSSKIGAKLVHFSTDYVFDGEKSSGYVESDLPSPINVYGKSKLAGENYVIENMDEYFIVRTSWLYGDHGKNFKLTMLKLAESMDEIRVVDDQIGCPTDVRDLVNWVIENVLVKRTIQFGIIHFSGDEVMSWADFARKIFRENGKDVKVTNITSAEFPSKARRPRYSVLRSEHY